MREYRLPLGETLRRGLKPRDVAALNTGYLLRCVGMRVREAGLERVSAIHDPTGLTVGWPHPQIFKGREQTVVADATSVYTKAVDSWTLTSVATVTEGGAWHFADFGTSWMLFNGVAMVVKTPSATYTYEGDPTINTGCAFGNRVIWAGLASDFWSPAWQTLLTTEAQRSGSGLPLDFDMKRNMVFWGAIGGGDAFVWLTEPTDSALPIVGPLGAGYGYDSTRPYYRDLLNRGDIGWAPMEWDGQILAVLPHGKGLVVYGSNGMSMLAPHDTDFGQMALSKEIGIVGRGAVAGNKKKHLFMGTDSRLYMLGEDGKVRNLDYSQFLSSNLDSAAVLAYDEAEDEFYIGGADGGYILSEGGLSETVRPPSSVLRTGSGLYGTPTLVSNEADRILVEWDTFNMGMRGLKQVVNVQVDYSGINNMQVEIASSVVMGKTPVYRTKTRDNGYGAFFSLLHGEAFRLRITGDPTPEASISDVVVRWAGSDKRFARGVLNAGGVEGAGSSGQ